MNTNVEHLNTYIGEVMSVSKHPFERAVLAAVLGFSVPGADLQLGTSLSSPERRRSGRRVLAPMLISMVSSAQTKTQARRTRTYRKVYP